MICSLHKRRPSTDRVLLVDITVILHQELSYVQTTNHSCKHQWCRSVLARTGISLAGIIFQNLFYTSYITYSGKKGNRILQYLIVVVTLLKTNQHFLFYSMIYRQYNTCIYLYLQFHGPWVVSKFLNLHEFTIYIFSL